MEVIDTFSTCTEYVSINIVMKLYNTTSQVSGKWVLCVKKLCIQFTESSMLDHVNMSNSCMKCSINKCTSTVPAIIKVTFRFISKCITRVNMQFKMIVHCMGCTNYSLILNFTYDMYNSNDQCIVHVSQQRMSYHYLVWFQLQEG